MTTSTSNPLRTAARTAYEQIVARICRPGTPFIVPETWWLRYPAPEDLVGRTGVVVEGPIRVVWMSDGRRELVPFEVVHPVQYADGAQGKLSDHFMRTENEYLYKGLSVPHWTGRPPELFVSKLARDVYEDIRARCLPAGESVTVSDATGQRPAVVLDDPARVDWALDEAGYEMPQVIHQAVRVDGTDSATWVQVERLRRIDV